MHDALRVSNQRGGIGGDEHFALADAEHDRAAVASDDDRFGTLRVEHSDAIGACHQPQRAANRVFQPVGRHRRDEMRQHFRIGFGTKRHAAGLQLRAQLRGVFDDAVVNDRETLGCIAVRMGVAIARFAVRRPARMCDAGRAFHCSGSWRSRSRTLPLLLKMLSLSLRAQAMPAES